MTRKDLIKEAIDMDIEFCCTPDLPSLRYHGGQPFVFLWDDTQDYTALQKLLGVDMTPHYESRFFSAMTKNLYVPWYNLSPDDDAYPAYCLRDSDDTLWLELEDYAAVRPRRLKGKLCKLSLQALSTLDLYYNNQTIFTREAIDVQPSLFSDSVVKAYTWFNRVEQIARKGERMYELDEGIDVTPFTHRTCHTTKGEYYEM